MEREGAMAVKWKAEWRRGGKSEGTRQGEGRKELSRKRVPLWEGGGMARFSQAANMLSRLDDGQPNNVMAAL